MLRSTIFSFSIFLAFGLQASELRIVVQDVFDLASYAPVFEQVVELSDYQKMEYSIERWSNYFPHSGFHIELIVEATRMPSLVASDKEEYLVRVVKTLKKGDEVYHQENQGWVMRPGQSEQFRDYKWGDDLIMRQLNTISVE